MSGDDLKKKASEPPADQHYAALPTKTYPMPSFGGPATEFKGPPDFDSRRILSPL